MPTVKFTGSGQPSTLTNLGLSTTDCAGGTGSYASCASGQNKGFHSNPDPVGSNDSYIYETPPITITSTYGLMGSLTSFRYSIIRTGWSSGATWSMVVELIPWTGTYGTPFRLDNGTELTNQTGAVTCGTWTWNPYTPKFDPNPGILSGQYVIRITATTTNTNTTTLNCVRFDEIVMDWTILEDPDSEPNGLTEPTFSKSTGTASVDGSNRLIADVFLTKSTQSATSCSGSGTGTSLCSLSAVNGRYIVTKTSKTTGNSQLVSSTTFSIPYQTSTWTYTASNAIHEDSTHTYEHWFEYEKWNSGGTDVESAFVKADTPNWPTKNLNLNFILTGNYANNPTVEFVIEYKVSSGGSWLWAETIYADAIDPFPAPTDLNLEKEYTVRVTANITPNGTGTSNSNTLKDYCGGTTLNTGTSGTSTTYVVERTYDQVSDGNCLETVVAIGF